MASSSVWSWGWPNEGVLGTQADLQTPEELEFVTTPTQIQIPVEASSISCGMFHCHVLLSTGHIYSWGRTANGRLGFPSKKEWVSEPTLVPTPLRFVKIACGHHHSLAITSDGKVASWGSGYSGQCGHGTRKDSEVPTVIAAISHLKFTEISAGYYHSIAIDENGEMWIWGTGKEGQLGLGDKDLFHSTPVLLKVRREQGPKDVCLLSEKHESKDKASDAKPKAPKKIFKAVFAAAGEHNSAALTKKGELFIWGGNQYGQLGNGIVGPSSFVPHMLTSIFGPLSWKSITFGTCHVIALTDTGVPYYWGRTMDQNLTILSDPTPLLSPDHTALEPIKYSKTLTTHALCITEGKGEIYATGVGEYGQLGLSTISSEKELRKIPSFSEVSEIAVGGYHSLALVKAAKINITKDSDPNLPDRFKQPSSKAAVQAFGSDNSMAGSSDSTATANPRNIERVSPPRAIRESALEEVKKTRSRRFSSRRESKGKEQEYRTESPKKPSKR
eukprot:TRINITY_DN11990_c0_g1_i1.p1 TRINITY_DN11990_c0_g1~~TRINITY_DN11990_c0_g1_i1.p1  ORF type:complete len:501 (+),score=87.74 TRINITY_DN11990_c0_g1_i1:19-1521(+)